MSKQKNCIISVDFFLFSVWLSLKIFTKIRTYRSEKSKNEWLLNSIMKKSLKSTELQPVTSSYKFRKKKNSQII
jgi:hypothetical protein